MIPAAAAIAVADLALPRDRTIIALLIVVPALTALGQPGKVRPLGIGALTLVVGLLVGATRWNARPAAVATTLIGIIAVTSIVQLAAVRAQRQRRMQTDLQAAADTTRKAILSPPPPYIGPLRTAARYLAAAPHAQIGGDLYEVLDTPFGVRILIGDVMGHGLHAVSTAAEVLADFRVLARQQERLNSLVHRLDTAVTRRASGEGFVTALFISIPYIGEAELLSCGHPPPLLLRGAQATFVDALPPCPPLGLLDLANGHTPSELLPIRPGDGLLLYTDGVTEARDDTGAFYPLADRAKTLSRPDPETFLDTLPADLLHHAGGRLHDDAALLYLHNDNTWTDFAPSTPTQLHRHIRPPSSDGTPLNP